MINVAAVMTSSFFIVLTRTIDHPSLQLSLPV